MFLCLSHSSLFACLSVHLSVFTSPSLSPSCLFVYPSLFFPFLSTSLSIYLCYFDRRPLFLSSLDPLCLSLYLSLCFSSRPSRAQLPGDTPGNDCVWVNTAPLLPLRPATQGPLFHTAIFASLPWQDIIAEQIDDELVEYPRTAGHYLAGSFIYADEVSSLYTDILHLFDFCCLGKGNCYRLLLLLLHILLLLLLLVLSVMLLLFLLLLLL